MSALVIGGRPTLDGTTQSLTTLIKTVRPTFKDTTFSLCNIRAGKSNAGDVFVGISDLDGGSLSLGYLIAGEALEIDILTRFHTDNVFLKGTNNDVVFIFGMEY